MTTPEQLLERLEAVERGATGPPAQTGERVWSAIEARLINGPAPPELDSGPLLDHAVEAAANVGGSSSVVLKVVGALAMIGVVGGGVALVTGDREPPPEIVAAVEQPAVVMPKSAEPKSPEPEVAEPQIAEPEIAEPENAEPESATPDAEPAAKPRKPATSKPEPATPRSLADEVALMQALSTALKRGDSRKALTLVAEHERDFAQGQFIEERRAAKARALCQSGKLAAGKKEAASFAARWPSSIHLAAVEQDCKGD